MVERRVLLIGGPPGAGKTTLGRAIAAAMGFASLTVDDLAVAARAVTSAETHPALHPMAGVGHTIYFTQGPPEKLIADSVALQNALWPAVERVVRAHATVKDSIVIDWWLLAPELVARLNDAKVASIWLHIAPDVLEERERANTEFLDGSADPERMLANFMRRSLWRNDLVASQARRLGLPVLHQDGRASVADLTSAAIERLGWALPGSPP